MPYPELKDLTAAVDQAAERALVCGALLPIDTESVDIEDHGVRFSVRWVSSLMRKPRRQREDGTAPANPFLPPDPALLVGDVSETHVALLNKFPVIARHLLVVTRAFEAQTTPLTDGDFDALSRVLRAEDWLGFYNGGLIAGASQPHKHLQFVPLPLGEDGPSVPMEVLFEPAPEQVACRQRQLPFAHGFVWLGLEGVAQPATLARAFQAACDLAGVTVRAGEVSPYNLLVTRRWLLVVARSQERWEDVSVNSLGFAGSLFVKRQEDIERMRVAGPMAVLRAVAAK